MRTPDSGSSTDTGPAPSGEPSPSQVGYDPVTSTAVALARILGLTALAMAGFTDLFTPTGNTALIAAWSATLMLNPAPPQGAQGLRRWAHSYLLPSVAVATGGTGLASAAWPSVATALSVVTVLIGTAALFRARARLRAQT